MVKPGSILVSPVRVMGAQDTGVIIWCFPRHSSKKLVQKCSNWNQNWCSNMECHYTGPKLILNSICYESFENPLIFCLWRNKYHLDDTGFLKKAVSASFPLLLMITITNITMTMRINFIQKSELV